MYVPITHRLFWLYMVINLQLFINKVGKINKNDDIMIRSCPSTCGAELPAVTHYVVWLKYTYIIHTFIYMYIIYYIYYFILFFHEVASQLLPWFFFNATDLTRTLHSHTLTRGHLADCTPLQALLVMISSWSIYVRDVPLI